MAAEGSTASASEPERQPIESKPLEIGNDADGFFSPRFKSAAAMAGWDEEALLIASLVVDDTPEREFRHKKRSVLQCSKSPPSGSRRKRRASTSLVSIPVTVLDLDEDESSVKDDPPKDDPESAKPEPEKSDELIEQKAGGSSSPSALPCMDKLREELSCAICLEICFEPSTTLCGHSFCKQCLRSAADKCGRRCPKCRQLISNGRSCNVNTVLWNTIQLLFPQEVEARKEAKGCSSNGSHEKVQDPETAFYSSLQNHNNTRATGTSSRYGSSSTRRGEITIRDEVREMNRSMTQRAASLNAESRLESRLQHRSNRPVRTGTMTRNADVRSRRRGAVDQDQDAAFALRLQREEFMEAFRGTTQVQTRSSMSLSRADLRVMAAAAALRVNGPQDL